MADFRKAIPAILAHEGGFVDDPDDPGGVTNFGITLPWLTQFEPDATRQTIVEMTEEEAVSRYETYIWNKRGYGRFASDAVAEKVMDMAINFGEVRGHKLAQAAANDLGASLTVDGVLGAKSIEAMNALDEWTLVKQMGEQAKAKYLAIVEKRPASAKFLKGWLRRAGCSMREPCKTCQGAGITG